MVWQRGRTILLHLPSSLRMPPSRLAVRSLMAIAISAWVASTGWSQAAPTVPSTEPPALPLVFLDCQAEGCDFNFLRTELVWMNFVRDKNQAMVHIIATSRTTASGGSELAITFERPNTPGGAVDSVLAIVPQSSTEDQSRRILSRAISQGMLRFVRNTPLADQLTVSYRAPTTAQARSDTRGLKDKWHLWVYRISAGGFASGDENYKSLSLHGNLRASRTTSAWKTNLSLGGDYRENGYALSPTRTLRTYQHSWNVDGSVVKSISERWSTGVQSRAFSSVQSNQDLNFRIAPAIEFDVYPYTEAIRRQIIFRYGPGLRIANYSEATIYDKLKETHPDHQLLVATEITQSWGSISASAVFNQLLDDPSKNNLGLNGYLSWRIITGLNLNVGGGYSRIRDQLNLKRGEQESEEVLLQVRQLRTGYSYYANVGLSYTFGSIFQNVVNPRFTLSGNNNN